MRMFEEIQATQNGLEKLVLTPLDLDHIAELIDLPPCGVQRFQMAEKTTFELRDVARAVYATKGAV